MLSKDALSQLTQLKTSIVSEKEFAEGVIRATSKRFGFVRLDDGRDAFVDPEQMLRVLPGDRVKVSLTENNKKQLEATLETLLSTSLKQFVGRYVRKGAAHFVEPDLPPFTRWLFIPPQNRTNCAEGDLVQCEVIRHPFKYDGKGQIKVTERIGRPEEAGIEGRYVAAKYQLTSEWDDTAGEQAQRISHSIDDQALATLAREDLTEIPFVTIDSEFTRDMDDALHCVANDTGWVLTTAIADPGSVIDYGSELELSARQRASTLYLLGHPITMLPSELSHETFSLVPEAVRPVLVCTQHIDQDGKITDFEFKFAKIKSHHKLNYQGVTDLLEGQDSEDLQQALPDPVIASLQALNQVAAARFNYRQQHGLVMEDRADFQYYLNDRKKIERIEKRQRNMAQKLVEEAMLATNICAGKLFSETPNTGLFSTHIGFRPERVAEVNQLIANELPELADKDFSELEHFRTLFRALRQPDTSDQTKARLNSLLQRMQQAGSLSLENKGHFGLGFEHYATVTSPIRRYQDLYNHYALKALLNKTPAPSATSDSVESIQDTLTRGRQATRMLESWLLCQYMSDKVGTVHFGTIVGVSGRGINVKLDDIGLDGFVSLSEKGKPKPKFDSGRLTLTTPTAEFFLDDSVCVKVKSVDTGARRMELELVDKETAERLKAFDTTDDKR
ncbi:VacB/RNase II family 3'-5' exoribonuclease [Gilvimarinus agarilyticus]|uniref:VacB/RNase II family 3'-5' exoribonuclease n=1 Tax=Gilvimarinus sp. 2_MG-2023 TaxID=3062666 RepID=UPI001C084A30|nr:VacB/RNase II family 3'-5' exoribonuclease [Gilvimarinus sp. 2_MG-2023]MBU2887282.1 VacB/RNase II family 3'-5' exoribonuclease [Gilvimarinus agarilyticus]MDO6571941.1 VacB/RNase II family 3'-5' exoribonuclease [Gilvimarinus sp. 2_MG-2023]